MKKLLFIACIAAASCAVEADEIVGGTTEIGLIAINSSAANTIISVPFLELANGADVCIANIIKTSNLTAGDILFDFRGKSTGWTAWKLNADKAWEAVGKASLTAEGMPKIGETSDPSTTTKAAGSALWLVRQTANVPVFVYGRYKQTLSTPVTAGKYNLIANPTDANLTTIPGSADGDKVLAVLSATETRQYVNIEGTWKTLGATGFVTADLPLAAGQGVWYMPQKDRTITSITWR